MNRWTNFGIIVVMWAVVLLFGIKVGGFAPWFLGICGGTLIVYLVYVQCLPINKIEVSVRSDKKTYFEGDTATITVCVQLPYCPLAWIGLDDHWHQMPIFPGFSRKLEYSYQTGLLSRGKLEPETLHLYMMDLFGWMVRKRRVETDLSAIVYPKVTAPNVLKQLHRIEFDHATKIRTAAIEDLLPEQVRDYQFGDPFNRIHWKASARTSSLKTIVPEKLYEPSMLIVLDTTKQKTVSDSSGEQLFEEVVRLAAAIVQRAGRQRLSPGLLLSQGANIIYAPPGLGRKSQRDAILKELALCRQNGALTWEKLLSSVPSEIRERSRIIGLSPRLPKVPSTETANRFEPLPAPHTLIYPEAGQVSDQQRRKQQWEQLGVQVVAISIEKREGETSA